MATPINLAFIINKSIGNIDDFSLPTSTVMSEGIAALEKIFDDVKKVKV